MATDTSIRSIRIVRDKTRYNKTTYIIVIVYFLITMFTISL
jgi:hypothetical protein